MTVKLTRAMREKILDGAAMDNTPVIRQHGKQLMRYDKMEVAEGRVKFFWRDTELFWFDLPDLSAGHVLTITGLEGTMGCQIAEN